MAAKRREVITASEHPIDWDKLRKGTWLSAEELEAATLRKRTHPLYTPAVLNLREKIRKRCRILCRLEGDRLRLMTDAEASAYETRQAGLASSRMERAAVHLSFYVERKNLTEAEQKVHEHATRVVVAMADAQHQERKKAARLFEFISTRPALEAGEDAPHE